MSDTYVGISEPSSPNAKLDAESLTVGANTVKRERVEVAGSSALEIAAVKAAEPASDAYGLVTRLVGMATLLSYLDGLEGSVDGIETLITATNTALTTIDGRVDGIEALLTTLNGLVDGLETLLAGGLPAALSGTGGLKTTPLPLSSLAASGTQSATVTGTALPSQSGSAVIVQADDDNTVDVYVGGAASQDLRLTPGASLVLSLDNLADVFVKTLSSTATVRYNVLA